MKKNKIFIAVDTTNILKAKKIISHSNNTKLKIGYKFGIEFLNSKKGRRFISQLKNRITFGDYKIADIPNTCASSIKAVKDLKFNYITIHISSGLEALEAAKKVAGKTKLIGVSILTSLDNKALREIGYKSDVKKVFKKEIITPGIRFTSNTDDQKRVMTPKDAFKAGATSLVIGRPITKGNIKKNIQYLINHLKR